MCFAVTATKDRLKTVVAKSVFLDVYFLFSVVFMCGSVLIYTFYDTTKSHFIDKLTIVTAID